MCRPYIIFVNCGISLSYVAESDKSGKRCQQNNTKIKQKDIKVCTEMKMLGD